MTDKFEHEKKLRLVEGNRLYVQMRWLLISTLVVTGLLARFFSAQGSANVNFPVRTMLSIMAFCVVMNIIFYWFYGHAARYSYLSVWRMTIFQIIFEIACMVMVIFFAGGIISMSFIYLTYSIVASGFFYSYLGVFTVTTFASLCYGGLIWGQYFSLIPYLPRYNNTFEFQLAHNLAAVVPNTFTIIFTYYFIGLFVSRYSRNITVKEREIRKERDKEFALIDGLSDGLIFVDHEGKIDMANKAAGKMLKLDTDGIIGRRMKDLPSDSRKVLEKVFTKTGLTEFEFVPTGSPDTHLQITSAEIKDQSDVLIGNAKIIHDVSRERFMEKMKSEFITIAGHQLRTPLSAIKNALSMLKDGDFGKITDEQHTVIGQSFEYTDRMIQLVNDLLNVSEVEEGRFDYNFTPVDLRALISEIADRFKRPTELKHITLETSITQEPFLIEADAYKLKLALGGIVDNAITYTPTGGWITIGCDFTDPKSVLISVADTGIGIETADKDKIFSKFFRSANALKFNTEGNGLDLFIAKNIIERHGGQIWLTSELREGSTFFIRLPATQSGLPVKKG